MAEKEFAVLDPRFDELSKRVDDNKRSCDHANHEFTKRLEDYERVYRHDRGNFANQMNGLAIELRASTAQYESIKEPVMQMQRHKEKTDESLSLIRESLASVTQVHTSNTFLIKWIMGLCSAMLVLMATNVVRASAGI